MFDIIFSAVLLGNGRSQGIFSVIIETIGDLSGTLDVLLGLLGSSSADHSRNNEVTLVSTQMNSCDPL